MRSASRAGRRSRRRAKLVQAKESPFWVRQTIVFPVVFLVSLLLTQFRWWLSALALVLWASIWTWLLVRDLRRGRPTRLRLVGLGVALLLLAAWPPVLLGASREDIAEAVFRHQLFWADTGTYYLEIDGEDPSEDFLRRFADVPVQVRAASRALRPDPEWRGDPHSPSKVTDRETGERGTILRIVSIGRL